MKAYGSGGIALRIINLGTRRCVESIALRLLYPRWETAVRNEQEDSRASGPVWTTENILFMLRIEPGTVQHVAQSL